MTTLDVSLFFIINALPRAFAPPFSDREITPCPEQPFFDLAGFTRPYDMVCSPSRPFAAFVARRM